MNILHPLSLSDELKSQFTYCLVIWNIPINDNIINKLLVINCNILMNC